MSLFTLKFDVSLKSGSWVYQLYLAPQADAISEDAGLFVRARQSGLGELVARLTSWLDGHEASLAENSEKRADLWYLLSDANLMKSGKHIDLLELDKASQPLTWQANAWSNERLTASMPIYKAISLFLGAGDRFVALDSSLAYLYSAWQWYNCAKQVTLTLAGDDEIPLIEELASAHRHLVALLDDPRFAQAVRWLATWAGADSKSGPLTRERLRLSMPLVWANQASVPGAPFYEAEPKNVLPAPGFNSTEPLDWRRVRLHPVFFSERFISARTAVRSLITDWLLPRYDFKSTLFLAHLLKSNRTIASSQGVGLIPLLWVVCTLGLLWVGAYGTQQASLGNWPACPWWLMGWLSFIGGGALIWAMLDSSVFPYLALPRLLGGILIGYSALVLESHAFQLSEIIWQGGPLIVTMMIVGVLAVGWFYLYHDVRPLVIVPRTAYGRALAILIIAVAATLLIGLAAVALATSACQENDICKSPYFWGPFGRVNPYLYIIYTPLALFTGLITQFIFEERTVTTSVWAPEEK